MIGRLPYFKHMHCNHLQDVHSGDGLSELDMNSPCCTGAACSTGCSVCSSATACTTCSPGFLLTGTSCGGECVCVWCSYVLL